MKFYSPIFIACILVASIVEVSFAGYALQFNSENRNQAQRVVIEESESLNIDGEEMTMEAWLYVPNPQLDVDLTFLNKESHYEAKVRANDFEVAIMTNGWAWEGSGRVDANEWTHVAATYDGQNVRNYVNGELTSTTRRAGDIDPSDDPLLFGTRPLANFIHNYVGLLDEVRIWNVARSAEEIMDSKNISLSGDEDGLVGYWTMDEGEGQVVNDHSGNQNVGMLGIEEGEDRYDPEWVESTVPIYAGEVSIDRESIDFPPTPFGWERESSLVLANVSEGDEEDGYLTISFSVEYDGNRPNWLRVAPTEGEIEPQNEQIIVVTVNGDNVDEDFYQHILTLECNASNVRTVEIPVSVSFVEDVGRLHGMVISAATDLPVADALVTAVDADRTWMLETRTDEEGYYDFEDTPAFIYDVEVIVVDFLPWHRADVEVSADEETQLDVELLHAKCELDPEIIDVFLQTDDEVEFEVTITNTGNGPLSWYHEEIYPEEQQVEEWSLLKSLRVAEELQNDRIQGAINVDGMYYVCGVATDDGPHQIYILNADGELTGQFDQPGESLFGMRDIAWDGELLWGSGETTVYGIDLTGDVIRSWDGNFANTLSCAWDPDRELLWTSGSGTDIAGFTPDGEERDELEREQLNIKGLAYWSEDPDGYSLYIYHEIDQEQYIHKMNPATNDTMFVIKLEHENGGRPVGAYISNDVNPLVLTFIVTTNTQVGDGGDRVDVWALAQQPWIIFNDEDVDHVLEPLDSEDLYLTITTQGIPMDTELEVTYRFHHDGVDGMTDLPVLIAVTGEGGISQRRINLDVGWNLISSNVNPHLEEQQVDFRDVFAPLVEAGTLILAKTEDGDFYYPELGWGEFVGWDIFEGYWVKMNNYDALMLGGEVIMGDVEVPLSDGWNLMSYFPRRPVDARIALSGIEESLIVVKDGRGRFWVPSWGFSSLGSMVEGKGYQLLVNGDQTLVYNQDVDQGDMIGDVYSLNDAAWMDELSPQPDSYSLLLLTSALPAGSRLQAFTSTGLLAGRGVVRIDGKCGITLWGDDPTTSSVDGFQDGETVRLQTASGDELSISGDLAHADKGIVFLSGGWGVANLEAAAIPVSFGIHAAYPNPFNSRINVSFGLETSAEVELNVYDLAGRKVATILNGRLSAGDHPVNWDADGMAAGVYILRLASADRLDTRKVILMK